MSLRWRGHVSCDHPGCDAITEAWFTMYSTPWNETFVVRCVPVPPGWCETQRPRLAHGCPRHRLSTVYHSDLIVGPDEARSDTEIYAEKVREEMDFTSQEIKSG